MECEQASPNDPLRQGDIFGAHPGTPAWASPWTRYGVILTADCDIRHGKAGTQLVFAPIVSHAVYLSAIWVPAAARNLAVKFRERLDKILLRQSRLDADRISRYAADLGGASLESLLEQHISRPVDGAEIRESATVIARLWLALERLERLQLDQQELQGSGLASCLREVARHRWTLEGRGNPGNDDFINIAESALRDLEQRPDVCLIQEIVGLDADMDGPAGCVVSLREFAFVNSDDIVVDRRSWYDKPDQYLRVCRLRGIYKSDLVHRFAGLFTRVGLEDHRIPLQRRQFQRSAQALFKEQID